MNQWALPASLAINSFLFFLTGHTQTLRPWMHSDVGEAWRHSYQGQGVTIQVIDNFSKRKVFGKLDNKWQSLRHGEWTSKQASMIAPAAMIKNIDRSSLSSNPATIILPHGLNVFNISSSAMLSIHENEDAPPSEKASPHLKYRAIIDLAKDGRIIISKSAGNRSTTIGYPNSSGNIDKLALALKATPSTIFVGALEANGTTSTPATMASYSNIAGTDIIFQKNFLVVGVEAGGMISLITSFLGFNNKTSLSGTSFAAPIISGYAAILGSKFTHATPTQIVNQLLDTARQDTIKNYRPDIHGRGEASLSRALSPVSIQ